MTRIGLYSDSHGFVDSDLHEAFKECDQIWHAGDLGHQRVLDQLVSFQKPFKAVYGNIDDQHLRSVLNEEETWSVEAVKIYMTHIGGYPGRYPSRIQTQLREIKPQIFICGHSHILKIIYDQSFQLLHLNPGACGHEGFHKMRTVLRFSIDGDQIKDMEVIELGQRRRI